MSGLILPKHLQREVAFTDEQARINGYVNMIRNLLARSTRDGLEEIVQRRWPRLPEKEIRRMPDARLWRLADGEIPEPPRFLLMSREDFYELEEGLVDTILSFNLEPIWDKNILPGRVSLLPESRYEEAKGIASFHHRVTDDEIGVNVWVE